MPAPSAPSPPSSSPSAPSGPAPGAPAGGARRGTWRRVEGWLRLGAQLAVVALALRATWAYWHDDAFITFRYAERVLAGRGLTWSGTEHVEGYTHPAWLGLLVLAGGLGAPVPLTGKLLGAGAALGAVLVAWRRWGDAGLVTLAVGGATCAAWAVSGLETAAVGALVLLAAALLGVRRGLGAGLVAAALPWVRPEGVLVGPIFAGVAGVAARLPGPWRGAAARLSPLRLGAPTLVSLAVQLGLRQAIYGEWLPNTAVAKLSDEPRAEVLSRGAAWLGDNLTLLEPLALALAAVLLGGLALDRLGPGRAAGVRPGGGAPGGGDAPVEADGAAALAAGALLATGVAFAAATVWEGGDHMLPSGRLLVPAVAALAGAAQAAGAGLLRRHPAVAWALTLGAALALRDPAPVVPYGADDAWLLGRRTGLVLAARLPPGTLVAAATAGSTPYYAPELDFIDTLGLNDRVIAHTPMGAPRTRLQHMPGHQRGNGAYVLSRAPDVVILGTADGVLGARPDLWFLTDLELLESPRFREQYLPWAIPGEPGDRLPGYIYKRPYWPGRAQHAEPPPEVEALGKGGRHLLIAWVRKDSPRVARLVEGAVPLDAWLTPDPCCLDPF